MLINCPEYIQFNDITYTRPNMGFKFVKKIVNTSDKHISFKNILLKYNTSVHSPYEKEHVLFSFSWRAYLNHIHNNSEIKIEKTGIKTCNTHGRIHEE